MNKRASLPVGDTLRLLRERKAMTQEELAQSVGVTQAMIGHLESNRRQPTLYMAARLAAVLGTSIDALVAEADPAIEPA